VQRRKQQRAGYVLEVRYRNAGQFLVSYCTNLSRGGLFVSTLTPLPVGSELKLVLAIPGVEPKQIDAVVRWTRDADDGEGMAGMGLSFSCVEQLVGDHIDRIVSGFSPLRIDLVDESGRAAGHIAPLVRSLVSCTTTQHAFARGLAKKLRDADLVIVDVEANPTAGLALLAELASGGASPPSLALCSARALAIRTQAERFARVVTMPVERASLQASVLQALTQVRALT